MTIFSRHKKYFVLFLLVGFVVYFPALINGFAWDDYPFILDNTALHHLNFQGVVGPSIFNSGTFYRPIPSLYFGTLYSLFGQTAAFYHLLQVFLHTVSTFL